MFGAGIAKRGAIDVILKEVFCGVFLKTELSGLGLMNFWVLRVGSSGIVISLSSSYSIARLAVHLASVETCSRTELLQTLHITKALLPRQHARSSWKPLH